MSTDRAVVSEVAAVSERALALTDRHGPDLDGERGQSRSLDPRWNLDVSRNRRGRLSFGSWLVAVLRHHLGPGRREQTVEVVRGRSHADQRELQDAGGRVPPSTPLF